MKKRIFISFAMEDVELRNLLVGQAHNDNSQFDFIDMSVKKPWDSAWKTNCRTKIKGCQGMIAIITKNSKSANGQIWEINCAEDEEIPCIGIWGHPDEHFKKLPEEISSLRVIEWNWSNIAKWLNRI